MPPKPFTVDPVLTISSIYLCTSRGHGRFSSPLLLVSRPRSRKYLANSNQQIRGAPLLARVRTCRVRRDVSRRHRSMLISHHRQETTHQTYRAGDYAPYPVRLIYWTRDRRYATNHHRGPLGVASFNHSPAEVESYEAYRRDLSTELSGKCPMLQVAFGDSCNTGESCTWFR